MANLRWISSLLFVAALMSCGKTRDPVLDVGPFTSYVQKFERKASLFGAPLQVNDLRIQFGKLDNPRERGVCEIGGEAPPTITIPKTHWDLMTEDERETLLFHEMGHCVLRRKHTKTVTERGIPSSLMNPYLIDSHTYVVNSEYYNAELFSTRDEL